ncbi:MAG: glutamine--fructose-6-phosphate transaminase (isomerizing) [Pseudomonadota bacterium]
MCGIIGYVGAGDVRDILLGGLRRLEYRGYDSAGLAVLTRRQLKVYKAAGKLSNLETRVPGRVRASLGIGHTRWATHGPASDENAHPHVSADGKIAVVHNGILENGRELRAGLTAAGVAFASDTDTEALAHLIAAESDGALEDRVRRALKHVHGTYGIAVCSASEPDKLVAARNGSPVVVGIGDEVMYVASDVAALAAHTRQVVHLDDGEIVALTPRALHTATLDAEPVNKSATSVDVDLARYDRGGHAHFMRREILDQPEAVARTLSGRLDRRFHTARLDGLNLDARELLDVRRIKLLGCGSAYYAGMTGAQLIEALARVPADAEPAAEFRYRNPVIERDTLYIAVSQSGETLDTLMAVQEIQRRGGRVLGIVNVVGSSIARAVDGGIYIHAGPEVSVASTKAYTCTLTALTLLALHIGRIRDLSPERGRALVEALDALPETLEKALSLETHVQTLASRLAVSANAFYIGRGLGYPIALEGAQKLKEISYVHAEAYPASELKHGPLALITPETPTVVALPGDGLTDKALASIEEVKARHGPVLAVGAMPGPGNAQSVDEYIATPASLPELSPVVLAVPLQLLAYHAALELDRDIDQPRNLAKSVTVE